MKKFISNLITFILLIISIVVFLITLLFCLEVFEVIDIPEKYSLEFLFYSKIEVIASGGNLFDDTVENEIDDNTLANRVRKNKYKNEIINQTVDEETWNELVESLKAPEKVELTEDITSHNFYYEQLDEYAKIIYDKLNSNIDDLKTGTYTADFGLTFDDLLHQENGDEKLKDSFQLAINALTFDTPDLFYIDVTKLYLLTQITTRAFSKKYEVSIGPYEGSNYLSSSFSDENSAKTAVSNIEKIRNDLVKQAENEDTVGKIKIVHDYLVDNVEYDSSAGDNIYNVYGTLINKRSVCEGYARSFKYVMDAMNIPCIIACGIAKNKEDVTESHAWNYVQIDDNWYAIDVTWDDPVIVGGGRLTEELKYEYFLKGSDAFFKDHFEDGNIVGESSFRYPTINISDYR